MTYRPSPHQITEVPPTYVTPPPRIPQPPSPDRQFGDTLLAVLSVASLVSMTIATATKFLTL
ncbi:hypothetical protein IAG44_26335 [Streptomyces roseirectus]|uniref:Uncharacterized protein n=1 Tax=Streptomyces roseirectus TaxID=2768066 RepID=A0A7H0III1_9ACTN|nr:hypothetical protein [Streptomyces roseirectus]QNP72597.1 hypothetical protein IAG44_26335 [Streptomyces roseirectus]